MKMTRSFAAAAVALPLLLGSRADAVPLHQYASSVIGFSSEYSSTGWSAAQALEAPNVAGYGDSWNAWAPSSQNGTLEYLTLGFATPVYASGVTVRETYGNGFVYQIDVLDTSDDFHTVWTGLDPSVPGVPGAPANFLVTWAQTPFLVKGVKVYVDTNHDLSAWEEIDSVQLHEEAPAVPEPGTLLLLGAGLAALVGRRRLGGKR